ncbi:hypothetical protein GCM10023144_02490 [Pigmentiphaga soli]|uniref:Uncharacterized protein n=1 Tax=Pigmentiphaga soli TaxID=1007095 RepID=A0ABP8GEE8_9BURK
MPRPSIAKRFIAAMELVSMAGDRLTLVPRLMRSSSWRIAEPRAGKIAGYGTQSATPIFFCARECVGCAVRR